MAQRSGQLRIIGGEFRSRRLKFPAVEDLRPTPDAVRETVFNWLRDAVANSRCLDLFAGSGAMGFEAISRGARHVTLVDTSRQVIRQLADNATLLGVLDRCQVVPGSAAQFLRQRRSETDTPFDIVFLDPPYAAGLIGPTLQLLIDQDVLSQQALVYIEQPQSAPPLSIPATWHIIRQSDRGMVRSHLVQTDNDSPSIPTAQHSA